MWPAGCALVVTPLVVEPAPPRPHSSFLLTLSLSPSPTLLPREKRIPRDQTSSRHPVARHHLPSSVGASTPRPAILHATRPLYVVTRPFSPQRRLTAPLNERAPLGSRLRRRGPPDVASSGARRIGTDAQGVAEWIEEAGRRQGHVAQRSAEPASRKGPKGVAGVAGARDRSALGAGDGFEGPAHLRGPLARGWRVS
jgi:hypothetical protein